MIRQANETETGLFRRLRIADQFARSGGFRHQFAAELAIRSIGLRGPRHRAALFSIWRRKAADTANDPRQ
jgi:hypothetical protein